MTRDYTDYINDILNSIEEIEEFIEGMDFETFNSDRKTINAVIRSLEVMGEAATKIPTDIREKYTDIPWSKMAGMRNKLIHEYFGVDLEIVWTVCTDEIPPIKPLLIEIQNNIKKESTTEDEEEDSGTNQKVEAD
ncbi:MAG: DUF86 domain-containing protein [Candidatus Aminicenantes bacterium]|nr:DUF86 domain-containing protein [Candidatus Aminicenantes bacterium]NIM82810.1 DUF86 domain-containing protein [Candidatus Aminicenantes bacterium]NIN22194.1 DUF86 domain-containing protein [Candidatus Aminicenantes bacterium]NIN45954.1 DUF86 domain-containing protein [Candidatus Aminicenantes bacterium]NIN88790.1 DUF86 domain-containing protein [Candidatus Aminicenantes bacterium]